MKLSGCMCVFVEIFDVLVCDPFSYFSVPFPLPFPFPQMPNHSSGECYRLNAIENPATA